MEDSAIVDLYWQRSERAIPETECKYGGYCHTVAMRIVNNREDAEECVGSEHGTLCRRTDRHIWRHTWQN